MKSDNHVYLIHFEIEKAFPRKCISMVYDRDTEQVTLLHAQQGNEDGSSKAVTHKFYFGAAKKEDGTYPEGRAHYTEDLVGEAIDFTYTSDFTWRHTYLQPHLYRWQLASAGELGQSGVDKEGDWQNDYCDFIKINDPIYLFSWIEKIACTQGMCLENLDRMYHVGCFFGVGPDGGRKITQCQLMENRQFTKKRFQGKIRIDMHKNLHKGEFIMDEICRFLKECETYFLATVEGDQPRVRPFGTIEIFENKLYFQTGKAKPVTEQIMKNPKIEICGIIGGRWLRLTGEAVLDDRVEAKKHMLDAYPELREMYDENDGNTAVFYIRKGTARIDSFTEESKIIDLA